MDLVIGGAYQGKLEYARRTYALTDEDLFFCTPVHAIDPGKRCICRLEEYVLGCVRRGEQPDRQRGAEGGRGKRGVDPGGRGIV